MLLKIICYFLTITGYKEGVDFIDTKEEIVFDKFSLQILTFITLPIMAFVLLIKDIKILVKIGHTGVYSIYLYIIFLLYAGIKNIIDNDVFTN